MIDLKKRIFITGTTGFVGASLLHRLVSIGARDVHILVRPGSSRSRIADIIDSGVIHIHSFSLEDREETMKYMKDISPQMIFHVAALGTAVGRNPFTIDEFIATNTLGTIHLIDAAREVGCELFVNTGSSSEYGQKDHPMREDDLLVPNNLYAVSKAGATQYATYIGQTQKFPIVTYRLFSVYGPLEDQKRLMPTLVRSYMAGLPPELSSPHSVRDFVYIDDVVEYYLMADQAIETPGDIINIGTGEQSTIAHVVSTLQSITGSSLEPHYGTQKTNQLEPTSWVADIQKMFRIFEHKPRSLRDGLSSFIQAISPH